jgi:UDP-glucose 4-epimerase
MTWLVTGGAGYIGSHVMYALRNAGISTVALDNLTNSSGNRLKEDFTLIVGDIRDLDLVGSIIRDHAISGVIHLAALKSPEESISRSKLYNDVNQVGTENLIKLATEKQIQYFIQSSTAAVYDDSLGVRVKEESVLNPKTPYGASKVGAENALSIAIRDDLISGMSLRYFNVVGSSFSHLRDTAKNNLFPSVIESIRNSKSPVIFGGDYPTPDGTCIRDYIHVEDIASGHLAAIKALDGHLEEHIFNLGTGVGYSVKEITLGLIEALDSDIEPIFGPRRDGDPVSVIADVSLARERLGFSAVKSLKEMIDSSI